MFHLKFGCLCGLLAPILYLLGKICTSKKLRLIQGVKYIASKLILLVIFYGNVHQQLASNVWALYQGKIQKCPNDAREFFALFWMLTDWLSLLELDRWATISWVLLIARNKFYFEKIQQHPKANLDGAISVLLENQRLVAAMMNSQFCFKTCFELLHAQFFDVFLSSSFGVLEPVLFLAMALYLLGHM